jgi:hypothetical protein
MRYPADLLTLPIEPAMFAPTSADWGFGFNGSVQMGRAHEGFESVDPSITGSIETYYVTNDGQIFFAGQVMAPRPVQVSVLYPLAHCWVYLVPFPPPVVASTLTYSVTVGGWTTIDHASGLGLQPTTFSSWTGVGETSNFSPQTQITADTFLGFTVSERLGYPDYAYQFPSKLSVQRSFDVQGGHTPAIALVVGVGLSMESGAEVIFGRGDSMIMPGSVVGGSYRNGCVQFHYAPIAALG